MQTQVSNLADYFLDWTDGVLRPWIDQGCKTPYESPGGIGERKPSPRNRFGFLKLGGFLELVSQLLNVPMIFLGFVKGLRKL